MTETIDAKTAPNMTTQSALHPLMREEVLREAVAL